MTITTGRDKHRISIQTIARIPTPIHHVTNALLIWVLVKIPTADTRRTWSRLNFESSAVSQKLIDLAPTPHLTLAAVQVALDNSSEVPVLRMCWNPRIWEGGVCRQDYRFNLNASIKYPRRYGTFIGIYI